jgi:type II secretory pathway pseudopilin PulG
MLIGNYSKGDTIIEVMLAFAVFAMLAVGSITIMNQGVASAQESLETTLVRQQIDSQAESLRFLHQAYIATTGTPTASGVKFQSILTDNVNTGVNASDFGDAACLNTIPQAGGTSGKPSFVLLPKSGNKLDGNNLKTMSDQNAPAYAQLKYKDDGSFQAPYGLWVEAVEGGEVGEPRFIDFHIRACWYSVTSNVPRTLGTIVRLYVPA